MDEAGVEYAGFWLRVAASVIDSLILLLVTTPLMSGMYGTSDLDAGRAIPGSGAFFLSLVLPAAATLLFWHFRQATPGKMLLRMRIVDATTGQGMSPGQSVTRYVGYLVAVLPLGLGILWVGIDPRKQGWHDKLAKTVVVRGRARELDGNNA